MYLIRRFTRASGARAAAAAGDIGRYVRDYVNLIASTSYPFPDVLNALSLPLSVLPLEGVSGRRYFPGSSFYDQIEQRGEAVVRRLFNLGADFGVSLQPHSGTQANQIVFNSLLEPEDVVLSLRPSDGGHISHSVLIGRRNRVAHCGILADGTIDYEAVQIAAQRERPKLIVFGSSSYPRQINFGRLGQIAKSVDAYIHADISHTALFVAAGLHADVAPHVDFFTFNCMKNLRGPNAGVIAFRSELRRKVENAIFPGTQGGPHENAMLAKLVAFENLLAGDIKSYAERILRAARRFAEILIERGAIVVTGGTDCHIVLMNLNDRAMTGVQAEERLERNRILANRNQVPGDPKPPWTASGIRFGLTCLSILEYSLSDVETVANAVVDAIHGEDVVAIIADLTARYNAQLVTPEWRED